MDNLKTQIAKAILKVKSPHKPIPLDIHDDKEEILRIAQAVLDIVEPKLSEWKELARKAWVELEQVDCNNPLVDELFDALSKDLQTQPEKE